MAIYNQCPDSEQQKEVNLLDLLIVLLKHKWLIVSFIFIALILTNGYFYIFDKKKEPSPKITPIEYYRECEIIPSAEPVADLYDRMRRANWILNTMRKAGLLNIYEGSLDDKNDKSLNEPPSSEGIYNTATYKKVMQDLELELVGSKINLGYFSDNKELPEKVINIFLAEISESNRNKDREILRSKQNIFQRKMDVYKDPILRQALAGQLIELAEQERQLKTGSYYGFEIRGLPLTTYQVKVKIEGNKKIIQDAEKLSDSPQGKQKYLMINLLIALASFIIAVFLAFFLEYLNNMRDNEPDKFRMMKKYLSLRSYK